MPNNVVCKKCNNLVNGWCKKVIDNPDPDMQRDCQHFREKTNADRIRAMSDEELAKMMTYGAGEFDCYECFRTEDEPCDMNCEERCLEWLRKPVEIEEA